MKHTPSKVMAVSMLLMISTSSPMAYAPPSKVHTPAPYIPKPKLVDYKDYVLFMDSITTTNTTAIYWEMQNNRNR